MDCTLLCGAVPCSTSLLYCCRTDRQIWDVCIDCILLSACVFEFDFMRHSLRRRVAKGRCWDPKTFHRLRLYAPSWLWGAFQARKYPAVFAKTSRTYTLTLEMSHSVPIIGTCCESDLHMEHVARECVRFVPTSCDTGIGELQEKYMTSLVMRAVVEGRGRLLLDTYKLDCCVNQVSTVRYHAL